jgi:hypothetical protein
MKKDKTDITLVLDRSGSMESVKTDTIGGVNQFINDQKKFPGEANFSLIQFDDKYDVVFDGKDLQEVQLLTDHTYIPRGMTALLDAIGKTIERTGKRLEGLAEEERPEKVVFVIQTDGYENYSKQFTTEKIADMISHQRDIYKWEFVFLGANQDAIASAAKIGIQPTHAMTYAHTPVGVACAFSSFSTNIGNYRSDTVTSAGYTDEDRKKQREAGA